MSLKQIVGWPANGCARWALVVALAAAFPAIAAPDAAHPDTSAEKSSDAASDRPKDATTPVIPAPAAAAPAEKPAVVAPLPGPAMNSEEFKREVMEEVHKELDKAKADLQTQVQFVESEADARNYDAEQLKELKETVNLLQLHGYFRLRGDLFGNGSLGTGPTVATGTEIARTLFPVPQGTSWLGVSDMRFRLNPVIRVSDRIAVYSQIDALDNAVLGGDSAAEPFFGVGSAAVGAPILSSSVLGQPVTLKRVWAEIETPVGVLSFGRMPFHFGEGMVYNDGNCLDCDFGTTFDGIRLTSIPFLGGHMVTLGGDYLSQGITTDPSASLTAIPTQQLSTGYRFSLQLTKAIPPGELKRRLDNNEWVWQYGALGAYRTQPWQTVQATCGPTATNPSSSNMCLGTSPANVSGAVIDGGSTPNLVAIHSQFGEGDVYVQAMHQGLRLALEAAVFGGVWNGPTTSPTQTQGLTFIQEAAVLRGQYSFLKQNALLIGLDLGYASGDNDGTGNMGARSWANASDTAQRGIVDGPVYSPGHNTVDNFQMNPDFRIDQLLWRNIFTDITNAYFARLEARYKLFGRTSGGGTDEGLEFGVSVIYSQAVFASATPSLNQTPLGVEFDPAITYTTHDHFFVGIVAGFLVPLAGLQIPNTVFPSLGQVYRGFAAVTF